MRQEYFSSLQKHFGYTANWAPNEDVHVGDWTDIKSGFLPWLNRVIGKSSIEIEINEGLRSVMKGSLGEIHTEDKEVGPMFLSYNVSMDAGISAGAASIKAKKAGGFFAILQDVHVVSAEPAAFQKKLRKLNKTSVAIVTSVTYAKQGLLVVFSEDTASFTFPMGISLDEIINKPGVIDLSFASSYTGNGVAAYKSENDKNLTPFIRIHIEEREEQRKSAVHTAHRGRNLVPEMSYSIADLTRQPHFGHSIEKYVMKPFSYTEFFDNMKL